MAGGAQKLVCIDIVARNMTHLLELHAFMLEHGALPIAGRGLPSLEQNQMLTAMIGGELHDAFVKRVERSGATVTYWITIYAWTPTGSQR